MAEIPRRQKGFWFAALSGALGAVVAVAMKIAFDFSSEGSSLLHTLSDRSMVWFGVDSQTYQVDYEPMHFVCYFGRRVSFQQCCVDWILRGVAFALQVLLSVLALRYQLRALGLLTATTVETTGTILTANILTSGIIGATVLGDWRQKTATEIGLWFVGMVLMIGGVGLISKSKIANEPSRKPKQKSE